MQTVLRIRKRRSTTAFYPFTFAQLLTPSCGQAETLDIEGMTGASCASAVEKSLSRTPAFKTTLVELLPKEAGTFPFTCGMGMLRGSLVVK